MQSKQCQCYQEYLDGCWRLHATEFSSRPAAVTVVTKNAKQNQPMGIGPMHSPEQLIQLHLQYDFGYANFREVVARWVIIGLATMVEHETTFKSYISVSY